MPEYAGTVDFDFAYVWTCPVCERRNYGDVTPLELTAAQRTRGSVAEGFLFPDAAQCGACYGWFRNSRSDHE